MSVNGPPARKVRKVESNGGEESSGSELGQEAQKALEEIDKYESELENINEEASEEIVKIEQKYNKVRYPIFNKRAESIPKVPLFWYTAFMNHPDLGQIVDECEEDCLHHWTKLEVQEFEDIKSGYRLIFHFDENPYFENSILVKEFHLSREEKGTPTSESTEIKWKEGFDIREQLLTPTKNSRKRLADQKSFFMWFMDNGEPTADDVAEIIKDDLWQSPLQYFLIPDLSAAAVDDIDISEIEDEDADIGTTDADEGPSDPKSAIFLNRTLYGRMKADKYKIKNKLMLKKIKLSPICRKRLIINRHNQNLLFARQHMKLSNKTDSQPSLHDVSDGDSRSDCSDNNEEKKFILKIEDNNENKSVSVKSESNDEDESMSEAEHADSGFDSVLPEPGSLISSYNEPNINVFIMKRDPDLDSIYNNSKVEVITISDDEEEYPKLTVKQESTDQSRTNDDSNVDSNSDSDSDSSSGHGSDIQVITMPKALVEEFAYKITREKRMGIRPNENNYEDSDEEEEDRRCRSPKLGCRISSQSDEESNYLAYEDEENPDRSPFEIKLRSIQRNQRKRTRVNNESCEESDDEEFVYPSLRAQRLGLKVITMPNNFFKIRREQRTRCRVHEETHPDTNEEVNRHATSRGENAGLFRQ